MPCDWQLVEELFHRTLELPADQRDAFLSSACQIPEVRREVESLLNADQRSGDLPQPFLRPASGLASGHRLHHYEILEQIGCGATGTVYRSLDTRTGQTVAIKVFPPFASSEQRRRFLKEVQAASALHHPCVVSVSEIGNADDQDFLVMEYVAGQTLGAMIPPRGLSVQAALPLARMMAEGLASAHAAGVVHRDLKPANIMVTPAGTLKIVDFGLAKFIVPGAEPTLETATGQIVGTACYLSPEQAEGKPVDARSDVFSIGAVMYEMLSGERPFDRGSLAGTLSAILRDSPPSLHRFRPEVPRDVARVVERCLEKDREQRYRGGDELLRDLRCAKRASTRRPVR